MGFTLYVNQIKYPQSVCLHWHLCLCLNRNPPRTRPQLDHISDGDMQSNNELCVSYDILSIIYTEINTGHKMWNSF